MHFRCGSYFGFLGLRRPVASAAEAGVSEPAQGSAAVTPADEVAVAAAPPVLSASSSSAKKPKRKKAKAKKSRRRPVRIAPPMSGGEASAPI